MVRIYLSSGPRTNLSSRLFARRCHSWKSPRAALIKPARDGHRNRILRYTVTGCTANPYRPVRPCGTSIYGTGGPVITPVQCRSETAVYGTCTGRKSIKMAWFMPCGRICTSRKSPMIADSFPLILTSKILQRSSLTRIQVFKDLPCAYVVSET